MHFIYLFIFPLQEIKEAAERILGLSPNVEINSFEFEGYDLADRYVKLVPESYQEAGWKVESIKRPAVVSICRQMFVIRLLAFQSLAAICCHSVFYMWLLLCA